MFVLLLVGAIVIGISRAFTEQFLFQIKDSELPNVICDSTREYHFFSVLGWLGGVYCLCKGCMMIGIIPWYADMVLAFTVFFLYYTPYSVLFNSMRGREWYRKNTYNVLFVEIPYITKEVAVISFIVSVMTIIFLQVNYVDIMIYLKGCV